MNFIKQIFAETRNMLRSKFIIVAAILIMLFVTVGVHFLDFLMNDVVGDLLYGNMYYSSYSEEIVINGVEYDWNNDAARELQWMYDAQAEVLNYGLSADATRYAQELYDVLIEKFEVYAPLVKTGDNPEEYFYDYRMSFLYQTRENLITIYLLEKLNTEEFSSVTDVADTDFADLREAVNIVGYYEDSYYNVFIDMTPEERDAEIAELSQFVTDFDSIMENDDFATYINLSIRDLEQTIVSNNERIEQLEKDIIENPAQEEYLNDEIDRLIIDNMNIEQSRIPEMDYRLEHNIAPNDGSWQESALNQKNWASYDILEKENNKFTEEEFAENEWARREYGTYPAYEAALVKEIQSAQLKVLVADNSLNSGEPDMSFVYDGARNQLYGKLSMLSLISVFAVLLGGWVIANEFQSGTVRLLMIRPRTRNKVFASKFLGGLVYIFIIYAATYLLSVIVCGFMYGFADFAYPNYTASGEVSFFISFMGDFLAGFASIIFMYALAFFCSSVIKNMAVSIIIPMLALVGTMILLPIMANNAPVDALAFTPVMYIYMNELFTSSYYMETLIEKGMPVSVGLGVVVMLIYSAVLLFIGSIVFRKKDITN